MKEFKSNNILLDKQFPLFTHYLEDFSKISDFFVWHPKNDIEKCAKKRLAVYEHRDKIIEILYQQNVNWKASELTLKNIEKLGDTNTLAVVTGQQAGIFGGPLYTVYKILQCIRTTELLTSQYRGFRCVPVFWMEVGDSDFKEINHINILNMKNELIRLSLSEQIGDQRSISLRSISEDIVQIFEKLYLEFPQNDFRDDLLDELKDIYEPGKNLADAFAEWIHSILKDFGVIIINPTERGVMDLTRPLLAEALKNWHQLNRIFSDQSKKLVKQGYHNQITLDSQQTFLFFRDDQNQRCRLDGRDNGFIMKGSQNTAKLPLSYFLDEMERCADKFTPNVAFRPVLQDYLLPSIIYIGGPAEISYAAQLSSIYDFFNVSPAVFHPRIRLTLIEEKIKKTAHKFGLKLEDFLIRGRDVIDTQVRESKDDNIETAFNSLEILLQQELEKIKDLLNDIDPTLVPLVGKTGQNFYDILGRLRNKVDDAYQRGMQIEINQMNKVLANLLPDDKFQERILNIVQYLVKYGPEFVPKLYKDLNIEDWDHHFIYL